MAWIDQEVYVLTVKLAEFDEEGEPMEWDVPFAERYAASIEEAERLRDRLLEDPDVDDCVIGDEPELRTFWEPGLER